MKVSDYMKLKLNNKGYMLVEIILASAIAFGLAFFIIDLTIKLKNKNDDLMVETLMNTDRTIINNKLMSYAKEEEANFDCSKLTIDKNTIKYKENVIDNVNAYGKITWDKMECSTDNGKISIKIPIDIPQMPDKEYDIIFDYKYQIGDMIPPTISFEGCESTNTITITTNDTGGSGFDHMNVSVFKGSDKDATKSKTNITSTSYTVSLDEDGTWTVYAQAYDKAGNRQSQSPETSIGWYYQQYKIYITKNGKYFAENRTKIANLSNNLTGGMYRYQGTATNVTNNYICFGTSTMSTCTENQETYMYRIVGITENGLIKIIKKMPLSDKYQWDKNTEAPHWSKSTLYKNLNGSYYLTNTTYVPSGWSDKIASTTWRYADSDTEVYMFSKDGCKLSINNGNTIYECENYTVNAKVGLMAIHDYFLSLSDDAICGYSSSEKCACADSWIHYTNNGSTDADGEWTTARWTWDFASQAAYAYWIQKTEGPIGSEFSVAIKRLVRPMIYLDSNVNIIAGTGTKSDPYIIGDQQNICQKVN